jgi:hypothetical protein
MKTKIFYLFALIVLAACKHKHDHPQTEEPINIQVINPKADSVYQSGNRIAINIAMSFRYEMHGYHLKLTNETNPNLVIELKKHTHGQTFSIDTAFTPNVTAETQYKLWVLAEKDHDGNGTEKAIYFKVKQP